MDQMHYHGLRHRAEPQPPWPPQWDPAYQPERGHGPRLACYAAVAEEGGGA